MLQAVDAIHQKKIVHSDLKPANFILVSGSLKLIDFGIAKTIANNTTNIYQEHQVYRVFTLACQVYPWNLCLTLLLFIRSAP